MDCVPPDVVAVRALGLATYDENPIDRKAGPTAGATPGNGVSRAGRFEVGAKRIHLGIQLPRLVEQLHHFFRWKIIKGNRLAHDVTIAPRASHYRGSARAGRDFRSRPKHLLRCPPDALVCLVMGPIGSRAALASAQS
jgi:hypothetical protein